jgi:hypothetical protein
VVPASLIPLFALGLPGSVSAAILIAALMIHGVTPGPRLFEEHSRLVFGIYGAMLIAAVLILIVGRFGLVAFAQLTRVPATIIIPVVTVLCIVGAYLESKSIFAVHFNDRVCSARLRDASVRLFPCDIPDRLRHRAAVRIITPSVAVGTSRRCFSTRLH